jgi:hypothetical protein
MSTHTIAEMPPDRPPLNHDQLLEKSLQSLSAPHLNLIANFSGRNIAEIIRYRDSGNISVTEAASLQVVYRLLIGMVAREQIRRQQPHAPRSVHGRYLRSDEIAPFKADYAPAMGEPLPVLHCIADSADLIEALISAEHLDRARVSRIPYSRATIDRIRREGEPIGSAGARYCLIGFPVGSAA